MKTRAVSEAGGAEGIAGLVGGERTGGKAGGAKGVTGGRGAGADFSRLLAASTQALEDDGRGRPRAEREPVATEARGAGRGERRSRDVAGDVASSLVTQTRAEAQAPPVGRDDEAARETARGGRRGRAEARGEVRGEGSAEVRGSQRRNGREVDQDDVQGFGQGSQHDIKRDGNELSGVGAGADRAASRVARDAGTAGSGSTDERGARVRPAREGEGDEGVGQAHGVARGGHERTEQTSPEASPAGPRATEGQDAGGPRGENDEAGAVRAAEPRGAAGEVRAAHEENATAGTNRATGRVPRDHDDESSAGRRAGQTPGAASGERGRASGQPGEPAPSATVRVAPPAGDAKVKERASVEPGHAAEARGEAGTEAGGKVQDGLRGERGHGHAVVPERGPTGSGAQTTPHAVVDAGSHGEAVARAHVEGEAPAPGAETQRTDRMPAANREAHGQKPAVDAEAPHAERPMPSAPSKSATDGDHAGARSNLPAEAPAPHVQTKSDAGNEAPRSRVPATAPRPDVAGRREVDGPARGERRPSPGDAPTPVRREAAPVESGKASEGLFAPGAKPAVARETPPVPPVRAEGQAAKPGVEAPAHALEGSATGEHVDHADHSRLSKNASPAGPADGARPADHDRPVSGSVGAGGARQSGNPEGQNQAPPRSGRAEAPAPQAPAPRELPRMREGAAPRPAAARAREARAYEAHRPAVTPTPAPGDAIPAADDTKAARKPAVAEAPASSSAAKRPPASARSEGSQPLRDGGAGPTAGHAFREESGSGKAMASPPAGDTPAPRKLGSSDFGEGGAHRREGAVPTPAETHPHAPSAPGEARAYHDDVARAVEDGHGEAHLPAKGAPASAQADGAGKPRSGEATSARAEAPAPRASGEAAVARAQTPRRETSPKPDGDAPAAHEGAASKPGAARANADVSPAKRETAPASETPPSEPAPATTGAAAASHPPTPPVGREPVGAARPTPAPRAATPAEGETPAASPAPARPQASPPSEVRATARSGDKQTAGQYEEQAPRAPASSSASPPAPPASSPPAASVSRRPARGAANDPGDSDAAELGAAAKDAANTVAHHNVIQQSAAAAQPTVPAPASEPEPEAEPRAKRAELAPAARPARRLDDLDLAHAFGDRPTRDDERGDDPGHRPRREAHLRDFDLIPGLAPQPAAPLAASAQVKPGSIAPAEAHAAAVAAKVATGAAGASGDDAASERREGEASATLPTRAGLEAVQQPLPVPFPPVAPLLADSAQAPAPTSAPPPPLPPELAGLPEDPGLSLSIMSQAAHLTIANDDGNALELHLRLLPEGADIRATGELAPLVHSRASELGHVLAAEGVTLGRFELGSGDRQGDQARRDNPTFERDTMDRTPTRSPSSARSTSEGDGVPVDRQLRGRSSRIHVKA